MTVDEIFTSLAAHMEKGIAIHRDFVFLYNFLGLKGFKKCHQYHYLAEIQNQQNLCSYYMKHYHKIIHIEKVEDAKVILGTWYKYNQMDVDAGTKRNTIRELYKQWIDWEKSTKELIQNLYKELCNLNEFAAAAKFETWLTDVSKELSAAEAEWIKLESIGYDLIHILEQQDIIHKEYKEKIKNLFKDN